VENEKVDKAALGYDYKGETEKHQSQKGKFNLCCYIDQHPGPQSLLWPPFGGWIVFKA